MRENDGRKLDHTTLEELRLRAVAEVQQGAHPRDVAAALGMHRTTIYAWLKKYRADGHDALLAKPVPGRPPRLNGEQLQRLSALLTQTEPRQFEFDAALWTTELVRAVILREFSVTLSRVSVSRQLSRLGVTPRRPSHRARQQFPDDVMANWELAELPRIAARAAAAGATVYFAEDARTQPGTMVCTVTAQGHAPRFAIFDSRETAAANFAEFCVRLVHDHAGPVYLVADGQPAHRARPVVDYATASQGYLTLFYRPAA